MSHFYCIFNDGYIFWIVQVFLIGFSAILFTKDRVAAYRAGSGGATLTIDRGHDTVVFYRVLYGAVSGVLVTMCISVEVIKEHRIVWILIDITFPLYIFIFNHWMRNKMSMLQGYLRTVEKR